MPMGEPVPPGVTDADDDESGSLVQVSVTLHRRGHQPDRIPGNACTRTRPAYQLWIDGNWEAECGRTVVILFQELDLQIEQRNRHSVGADRCGACALFRTTKPCPVWSAPLHHRRGPVEPAGLCADARAHGAGGPSAAAPRRHPGSGRPHRRRPRPERLASVCDYWQNRQRHTVQAMYVLHLTTGSPAT